MLGPPVPLAFLWLKGRRHLSSRNDFNWQRVETATSQRSRNNCFLTLEMDNGAPANFLDERDPHHAASGAGLDAILRPGVATPALLAPGGNEPSSE